MITADEIVKINELVTNTKSNRNCSGCLSSYLYYDTIEKQISSIVYSLIKGHYFIDGNKRTAFTVFITLCKLNGANPIQTDYIKLFEELASSNFDIDEVSIKLFGE